MSFIDMLANDIWSEADIKARLHAEIRSEISEFAETELNRALQGAALKMHTLTPSEMVVLMRFKAATDRAAALGVAARSDMALLNQVIAYERAASQAAAERNAALVLAETEPETVIPELLPEPVEGDEIYAVWRLRNPIIELPPEE